MSFSYRLLSSDAAEARVARVRMELGDSVENAGVLPDGSNLRDEEITLALTDAGNDVGLAVASLCGLLARRWSMLADVSVGPRREMLSQVARAWEERAKSALFSRSFVTGMARVVETEAEYG